VSPQIQDPALAERLRRKFAIVGSSTIDTIAPELVGVVLVDSLLPEREDFDAQISAQTVGDTGDIPEFGLINLAPSRHLKITQVHISVSSTGVVRLRLGQVGGTPGAGGNTLHTDMRNQLNAAAVGSPATNLNSAAGSGAIIHQTRIIANTPHVFYPRNLVLDFTGAANFRDRVHTDAALTASTLNVTFVFHFIEPEITRPPT